MNYYNNNGYYMNPQQYNPQQFMTPNMMQMPAYPQVYPQQSNEQLDSVGFIWVQGKEGAKAYPVAPNKTVLLLDSENPYVYKKQADKDGKPVEFKIYKLVEEIEGEEVFESSHVVYATKDELQKLHDDIEEIKDTLLDIQTTPDPPKRTRRTS